jgi:hypothetical protein
MAFGTVVRRPTFRKASATSDVPPTPTLLGPALQPTRGGRSGAWPLAAVLLVLLAHATTADRHQHQRRLLGTPPGQPNGSGQTLLSGAAAVDALTNRSGVTAAAAARAVPGSSGPPTQQELIQTLQSDPALRLNPATAQLVWVDAPVDESSTPQPAQTQPGAIQVRVQRAVDSASGPLTSARISGDGAAAGQAQAPPAVVSVAGAAAATPLDSSLEPSLSDALALHSRPSAYYRIILHFTGEPVDPALSTKTPTCEAPP